MMIDLPTPPSINDAYRNLVLPAVPGKRAKARAMKFPSNEMLAYKKEVARILTEAGWKPLEGDVVLTVWWSRARRVGDLSNRIKVLEDALKGYAFIDDSQVSESHCYRSDDKDNPGVTVAVSSATQLVYRPSSVPNLL